MSKTNRRDFLRQAAIAGALGMGLRAQADDAVIPGFEASNPELQEGAVWTPISDRKIRVGIVGYGVCRFGAAFSFQDHPNVEIVAVSDLQPDNCAELARVCRCETTYPSLEELILDDKVEAVFIATDAPSHCQNAIDAMERGKDVAVAVPAVFGNIDDAHRLYEAVKKTGRKYMLFETSAYHDDVYAQREIYRADGFGKMIYTEGEYYHYMDVPIPSFRDWRVGLPPQWYPTHSNGYYNAVTGGHFTEVSCMGIPSIIDHLKPENNIYKNPFGTEIALFRTSEQGMARMGVSWDTPGHGGEKGRNRGEHGTMEDMGYQGRADLSTIPYKKPALPPGVVAGGHRGSHGYLTEEFVSAILQDRQPLVDIHMALNLTVSGIIAHESALRDGELMKIPVWTA